MENGTLMNSLENTDLSLSDNTTQIPAIKKLYFPLIILLIILISSVIFGLGRYYVGNKLKKIEPIAQTNPITTNGKNTKKLNFSESLSRFCIDNKIDLDRLPFTLNQMVKDDYNIQDSIDCFVPDENYASMSVRVKGLDFSGDIKNIYFFHKNSKYIGMGNSFQSVNNYKAVVINGENYWLNVRDPDPYGISSLGVWIDLIKEKKDLSSGTIVRVVSLNILKDKQFIDLVKKYGSQITGADGKVIYVVSPTKKVQFIDEIVKLTPLNDVLKVSAQNLSSDLNGVSF